MSRIDFSEFEGHTPGPWTNPGGDVRRIIADQRPEGFIQSIGSVYERGSPKFSEHGRIIGYDLPGERDANARLIKAAPALLARCIELESTPQHVALEKALERLKTANREIEALSDQARHLRVANEIQRNEIKKLKAKIEREEARK